MPIQHGPSCPAPTQHRPTSPAPSQHRPSQPLKPTSPLTTPTPPPNPTPPTQITARSTGNGRPGGSVLGPVFVHRKFDLTDEPVRGLLRSNPHPTRGPSRCRRRHHRRRRRRRRRKHEPDNLPGLPLRPHPPALADRRHHGKPPPTRGSGRDVGDVAGDREPGIVVVDGNDEVVEQQLDLDGARLVGLGVPVDVGQELCHTERRPVYEWIEMPVAQLRRYDSADLADPRRQGLELYRAVPAWVSDHGCDSPTRGPEEHGVRIQQAGRGK